MGHVVCLKYVDNIEHHLSCSYTIHVQKLRSRDESGHCQLIIHLRNFASCSFKLELCEFGWPSILSWNTSTREDSYGHVMFHIYAANPSCTKGVILLVWVIIPDYKTKNRMVWDYKTLSRNQQAQQVHFFVHYCLVPMASYLLQWQWIQYFSYSWTSVNKWGLWFLISAS